MIIREDKVKSIRMDYNAARRKTDHYEAIVYCVEQNPDCMSKEFSKAIYPLHSLSIKSDSTEKQKQAFNTAIYLGDKELWRIDKHNIVNDSRFPDQRIIAVKREIKRENEKPLKFMAQAFAQGQDAINAYDRRGKLIKGIENERADYLSKAHDANLQRRLAEAKRKRAKKISGT